MYGVRNVLHRVYVEQGAQDIRGLKIILTSIVLLGDESFGDYYPPLGYRGCRDEVHGW